MKLELLRKPGTNHWIIVGDWLDRPYHFQHRSFALFTIALCRVVDFVAVGVGMIIKLLVQLRYTKK